MSKTDKAFDEWWKDSDSTSKEIARIAFKAGAERTGTCKLRLRDLKPGDMFRCKNGRQVTRSRDRDL